jgi:hypothetical protein
VFDLPSYVWALVLAGTVGMPAVTCVVLYRGATAARLDRRTAVTVATVAGLVLGGWLVTSAVLAGAGAYRQDPAADRPWLGAAIVVPFVAILLAARIPVVSRILAGPGMPARLAMPQTLRIVGGTFLAVWALGKLPAVFVLPAGLGDIAVGAAAPFVARRLARGRYRSGLWFNVLGLVDLVVAVTMGSLAAQGLHRLLAVSPSTEGLALLPLALIPTTAVPLAAALHVISLRAAGAGSATGPDRHVGRNPAGGIQVGAGQ